jgi:hypothetical protein
MPVMRTRFTSGGYPRSDALQAAKERVMSKFLVFDEFVLKDRRLLLAALADLAMPMWRRKRRSPSTATRVTGGPRRPRSSSAATSDFGTAFNR